MTDIVALIGSKLVHLPLKITRKFTTEMDAVTSTTDSTTTHTKFTTIAAVLPLEHFFVLRVAITPLTGLVAEIAEVLLTPLGAQITMLTETVASMRLAPVLNSLAEP
jgi:hypothetical protein